MLRIAAQPGVFEFDPARTALVLIDMQLDFLEPGGFGESLGNDVSKLATVRPGWAARRCSRVPMSTAAAPSTMPEELPAWWTWAISPTSG